jgi:RimJ/RimL family protein N-acetyltransferase
MIGTDVMATTETGIPTITTRRLMLRGLTEQDAESLCRILSQDGVLRYFPNSNPPALERIQNMIARHRTHWKEYGYGRWAIVPRTGQACIGWAGLEFLPEMNEAEVAYLLSKDYWGQGQQPKRRGCGSVWFRDGRAGVHRGHRPGECAPDGLWTS